MKGIEIHDRHPRGYLSFDLKDILACLHEQIAQRTWLIADVECTGEACEALHELSDGGDTVPGLELVRLSEHVSQVIDGTFSGFIPGESSASLIIQAIDSSFWEVFGDAQCLHCIQAAFQDVRPALTL